MNRRSFIATLPAAALASQVHPPVEPTDVYGPATQDELDVMTIQAAWHYGDGSAVIESIDFNTCVALGYDSKGRFIIREDGEFERLPS